jgi:hypothetical protein
MADIRPFSFEKVKKRYLHTGQIELDNFIESVPLYKRSFNFMGQDEDLQEWSEHLCESISSLTGVRFSEVKEYFILNRDQVLSYLAPCMDNVFGTKMMDTNLEAWALELAIMWKLLDLEDSL